MVSFLWQQAVTWGVSQHWKDFRMSDKTCSWHQNCQYHWISIDQWYQGAPIDFGEIQWPAVYNLACEAPTITRLGSPSCGLVKLSLVRSHLSLQKGLPFSQCSDLTWLTAWTRHKPTRCRFRNGGRGMQSCRWSEASFSYEIWPCGTSVNFLYLKLFLFLQPMRQRTSMTPNSNSIALQGCVDRTDMNWWRL